MLVDLHTHTSYSDGLLSPSELVQEAVKAKIECLAITDHDTLSGCKKALETVKKNLLPISIVSGVELSVDSGDCELHLLGLFIDNENEQLNECLSNLQKKRKERVYKILDALKRLNLPIEIFDVECQTDKKIESLGRPHIAAALVNKGYFFTQQEVFDKVLYFGGPAYVHNERIGLQKAIGLIHDAGGLAIIAHPYKIKNQKVLNEAVKIGVDGLEVYYPYHTPEMIKNYLDFAYEYKLKISGGSDFHGSIGKYPKCLGRYLLSSQLLNLW